MSATRKFAPSLARLALVLLACSAVFLLACSSTPAASDGHKAKKGGTRRLPPPKLKGPPGLHAVVLAELADVNAEVRFARNGKHGLLLARRDGRWLSGPVAVRDGNTGLQVAPAADGLHDVAAAPQEARPAALHTLGKGFVLIWVEPVAAGDALRMLMLRADGTPEGKPRKLTRAYERVQWIEVLSGPGGAFALWQLDRGDTSDLVAAKISRSGVGDPEIVARSVAGWHAVASKAGAAVAWVSGLVDGHGKVMMRELSDSGMSETLNVTAGNTALADVQLASLGNRFALAWTDVGDGDPHVHRAIVAPGPKLSVAPAPGPAPVGAQALIALVASADGKRAALAWEHVFGLHRKTRQIELATLSPRGELSSARVGLEYDAAAAAPHIVADGPGFAALTLATMSLRTDGKDGANATPRRDALTGPVYVRFDAQLSVRAAEPIRVDQLAKRGASIAGVPETVRNLSCDGAICTAVARSTGSPALMLLVSLPARESVWRAPAQHMAAPLPPNAETLDTLVDVKQPIADVATARLANGSTLVTWISYVVADKSGKPKPAPAGATLAYRIVDADGKAGQIRTLSERAISVGGVDVVALPASKKRGAPAAVIGWAGPNNRASQVYLTQIDRTGAKIKQRTVTKIRRPQKSELPNEVFDITLAVHGRDVLCAWSDTRDGDLEIYMARVDKTLHKAKPDVRITRRPGPSTEASLTVVGGRALLAWSDTAEGQSLADIFTLSLDARSLKAGGKPQRAAETPGHSRTPRWAGGKGALALAWIEEPTKTNSSDGELRLMAVDDKGGARRAARRVTAAGGAQLTSAAVSCKSERCRGVVIGRVDNALMLGAFDTMRESGAPVRVRQLAGLPGGTEQDLSLRGSDGLAQLFFAQDGGTSNAGARIRHLQLSW
jgi:hypothetical protein